MRSATSRWLPTSAVPAPPRTSPIAGPQVGGDLQAVRGAAVQGQHAPLALRLAAGQSRLHRATVARVESRPAAVGLGPRLRRTVSRVITCSRMPKRTVRPCSAASPRIHAIFSATCGRRFAPGQVDVGVPGGDRARPPARSRRSRPRGTGSGSRPSRAPSTRRCSPSRSTVSPRHSARTMSQELAGPRVALVLVQEVAVGALLVALAAGHHVEQQPSAGRGAGRWRPSARRAWARRSRAGRRRGTSAARSPAPSMAVVSQASSHHAPVGVSAPTKPSCSAARAIWVR